MNKPESLLVTIDPIQKDCQTNSAFSKNWNDPLFKEIVLKLNLVILLLNKLDMGRNRDILYGKEE